MNKKICYKCGESFPATSKFFYRTKARRDGLRTRCKKCCREYQKQYKKGYRKIYEDFLGRKLNSNEHIHHIDCNIYNNKISNLYLTDYRKHLSKVHKSLNKVRKELADYPFETISIELFQKYLDEWIIIFDKDLGIYMVCI